MTVDRAMQKKQASLIIARPVKVVDFFIESPEKRVARLLK
jgi:hypothetical protein